MGDRDLPDSIAANVAEWTESNAQFTDQQAETAWLPQDLTWGVFEVREDSIGSPLGDVSGLDVVELGCGTAYFSAQLAHRGARPVGVDPTPAQLATARRMMEKTGVSFPLVEAPGERVPLPDASFDLAVSEFGASLWADPQMWVPEAARLLRPGGRLVFLTNSFISYLCAPDEGGIGETLLRPQFGAVPHAVARRDGHRISHRRTASGSTCCGRTASRSNGSSSSWRHPRRRRTRTTTTSRRSGRGSGRTRRSGWPACVAEAALKLRPAVPVGVSRYIISDITAE